MIQDRVRTETYRRALEENSDLIKGKVVLDIGCGTGILRYFLYVFFLNFTSFLAFLLRAQEQKKFSESSIPTLLYKRRRW